MNILENIMPGKWFVADVNFGSCRIESDMGKWPENRICSIYSDAPIAQRRANIKAICAVPDMLAIINQIANATSLTDSEEARSKAINLLNELNK